MSYNKNTRRTGARASAVPLPPPPSLTDLAEWPYLESSAARARTGNARPAVTPAIGDGGSKLKHSAASSTAVAASAGDSSSAQRQLGDVNGGSLPRQDVSEAQAQDDYSMVTEQGTTTNLPQQVAVLEPQTQDITSAAEQGSNLPQQAVLETQSQDNNNTAAQPGSGMPQQTAPEPNSQEAAAAAQSGSGMALTGEYKAIWDNPNAAYPVTWWKKLPMGVDVDQAVALWVRKGRIDCAICGTRHAPPHDMAVQRRNLEKAALRRQQKLEEGSSASASRAQSSAGRRNRRRNNEDKASERCQLCGNLHSGPCRAPLCVSCGQYHFQKKGTACVRRGWAAVPEMPSVEQQRRNARAAILGCKTEEQVQFWTELLKNDLPGHEMPQQQGQQQQQQQDRPPPRQNHGGSSSHRPRGRSASPRGEEPGGGGSYRDRSPNTRRNGNKGGGRGPSRRPPRNG